MLATGPEGVFLVLTVLLVGVIGFVVMVVTFLVGAVGAVRRALGLGRSRSPAPRGLLPRDAAQRGNVCTRRGCGRDNPAAARYCGRCGHALRAGSDIDAYG
jgi:hypothetical protein